MRTHRKNITATVVDHHKYKLIQYNDIIIKLLIYIPNSAVSTLCGSSPESGTKTTRKWRNKYTNCILDNILNS